MPVPIFISQKGRLGCVFNVSFVKNIPCKGCVHEHIANACIRAKLLQVSVICMNMLACVQATSASSQTSTASIDLEPKAGNSILRVSAAIGMSSPSALVNLLGTTLQAQPSSYKIPSNFEPFHPGSHLEWRLKDEWAVFRRSQCTPRPTLNSISDCNVGDFRDRYEAWQLHPQHPLIRQLGFPRGFPGAMLYCPSLKTAFWSDTIKDSRAMLREFDDILTTMSSRRRTLR